MGNLVIPVDNNLYSTLKIGSEAFPFELFHDDLDNFSTGFVNWHKQKQIEISYVLEGSIKVCLLKEEHIITAGNAFIIFPEKLHSIQPVEKECGKYFTIIFDPCLITGYSGSYLEQTYYSPVLSSGKSYYFLPNLPRFQNIFSDLFWICETDVMENQLSVQRKLQDVWISLFNSVFQSGNDSDNCTQDTKILQMIEYLRQNYADKFSLSAMADALHVSRGECCRFFKKMMGMTISDYLLEYRLTKATELLENTTVSITEIAHTVGFNSVSNFSALFKEKTGYTPRGYRHNLSS